MAREEAAKLLSEKAYENDEPLDFLIRLMRDPTQDMHTRLAAARAAAPYRHPQLSAVAHRVANADGSPIGPTVIHHYLEMPKAGEVEHVPDVPLLTDSKH